MLTEHCWWLASWQIQNLLPKLGLRCFSGILRISSSCFQLSQLPTTVIINFLHFTKTVKMPVPMSFSEHDLKHYLVEKSSQIFLNFLPLYCYFTLPHSFFFPDAIQEFLSHNVNGLYTSAFSVPSITPAVSCVFNIARDQVFLSAFNFTQISLILKKEKRKREGKKERGKWENQRGQGDERRTLSRTLPANMLGK